MGLFEKTSQLNADKTMLTSNNNINRSIFQLIVTLCFITVGIIGYSQGVKKNEKGKKVTYFNNKKQAPVKVEYGNDKDKCDSLFTGITIVFGIGFDTLTTLFVQLNNKEITKKRCLTNYSIGYCMDEFAKIANAYMPFKNMKKGDSIFVSTQKEFIVIKVPENIKSFNTLNIYKDHGWNASFRKQCEILSLE